MTKQPELRECPFCPAESSEQELECEEGGMSDAWWKGTCDSGCCGPWRPTKEEAIAAWNHRSSQWVRVERMLPEDGAMVLTIDQYENQRVMSIHSAWWDHHQPVAWQHLPPPPDDE